MSVSYEEFFPEVLPFFPNLPEIVVLNAIRNACIEFCDRSDWLVYTPVPFDIIDGQSDYDLTMDLPDETTVARVQSAWVNQLALVPRTEDELRQIYNLDWRQMTGRPVYFTLSDPTTLTMAPVPDASYSQSLTMILVVRPTRASTTVDESIYERWLEVIAVGARSRLHELPGEFFSEQSAVKYKTMFNAGVDKAIAERTRGLTRRAMRVRPPRLV